MSGLIFFISCVVVIIGIIIYNIKRVRYTSWYEEGNPSLSFEEFLSFYNINPGRWEVKDAYDWDGEPYNMLVYYAKEGKLIFSWKTNRDRNDYLKWTENKKRQERDIKTAETLATLTKNIRKDVKFYNEKAQNEAQKTYDRILKMMEEE
jgi:hypothetical protein